MSTPEPAGATSAGPAAGTAPVDPSIAALSYEEARDELVALVRTLESGSRGLEESLALWERGEALAEHCRRWLEGARQRLEAARARSGEEG